MIKYNILITGGAGFIGSNLVARLLNDDRVGLVRVVDDLSTGKLENINQFFQNPIFEFIEGDICNYDFCINACNNIDIISHQAALGSVPRSIKNPIASNDVNVSGFLNILNAARLKNVSKVVFASSSATYGDSKELPKVEKDIGLPISPYGLTKYINELYAFVYNRVYGLNYIGLRYFNVYGPKQDPNGAYAAVIPLFINSVLNDNKATINGDGFHSRDFTYVEDVIQANILAIFSDSQNSVNKVYNIACGNQTSLNKLWDLICKIGNKKIKANYGPEREGDIKHSLANISNAETFLGYSPNFTIENGLDKTYKWFKEKYL